MKHFRLVGGTTTDEDPIVTANPIKQLRKRHGILFGACLVPALTKLSTIGHSTVIPVEMERGLVSEGYRVTLLPDFEMNHIYYDTFAREKVLVTNGTCVLDHESPNGFKEDHNGTSGCIYKALECFAIRAIIEPDGSISVGTVMRKVNHAYLEPITTSQEIAKAFFDLVLQQYESKKSKKLSGKLAS
jgi:hypothetical protein